MCPLNFSKQLLLSACLSVISLTSVATPNPLSQATPDETISQLYHSLKHNPSSSIPSRIEMISGTLLGKPYLLGALGEGPKGYYHQNPLYRMDAFDCETYVDTVLALALAHNLNQFKQYINHIRYRDGQVSFIHRNHFTCLDWNKNNQHQGFIKDITDTIRDKHQKPIVKYAHALIDKPSWYRHFSIQMIQISHLNAIEKTRRLQSLKQEGQQLSATVSVIPYIPLSTLFDTTGKANQQLFDQIPNAAIIEIIRPNWDLSKAIGTHLNVSHLGFVIREKNKLFFREASSVKHAIIDMPLIDYLREAQKSPTIKGVNIQIPLPNSCEP